MTKEPATKELLLTRAGSLWFQRFMLGCKKRMGQDWRPNQAISAELVRRASGKLRVVGHGGGRGPSDSTQTG
jgi:hypothetical protein